MPSILNRLQSGWNAFMGRDPTVKVKYEDLGLGSSYRPDKQRFYRTNDKSIVSSVICRIAIDAAALNLRHVRTEDEQYVETLDTKLNELFVTEANIDQTGRAFIQDVVMSMCDEGVVAIVPTDTTTNPFTGSYEIDKLRTGRITEWYPEHVRVDVYNERTGKREEVLLPKAMVAIIENPFYAVMNEPNSTLQRLKRTLANLDILDDRNASGKLDLIIQLPYVIKSELRKQQAEERRKDIEMQLIGSKYGVAYTDGTERIIQLNRPIENNYWAQAKELTSMLYNQLGLTESVFDGTADEATMNNYYSRTIEPILTAIIEEMRRKFLTKTARSQGQSIKFFRDPFKLVTVEKLASIADTFTRNEIASSNEIRREIGWKPSNDPKADALVNSNINQGEHDQIAMAPGKEGEDPTLENGDAPEQVAQEEIEAVGEANEEPMTNDDLSDEELDKLLVLLKEQYDDLTRIKAERNG